MKTSYVVLASILIAIPAGVAVAVHGPAEHADLTIDSTDWTPEHPIEGENVTFTATIRNDGDADATTPFNVTFHIDGEQVGENKTVDSLRFGEEVTVESDNWTSTAGTHELAVVVDSDDQVPEDDEGNNEASASVDVAAAEVDFAVTELTWAPEGPIEGENVTFTATVENQGNVASDNTTLRFLVNGTVLGADVNVSALEPGENTTVSSTNWTAAQGENTVEAIADPANETEEADEDNNSIEATVTVEPIEPDLVVDEIALSPEEPEPGENVTFTATVTNQGNSEAGNFTVRFLVNGTQLGDDVNVSGLAAGASTDVESVAWNASDGQNTVTAVADAQDNVTEADEDNNQRSGTFLVGDHGPNLVAEDLEVDPEEPAPGNETRFNVTVENDGDRDAGTFVVQFLLDGEQLGDNKTVSGLAAGASLIVTSDAWTATEGEHTIRAVVDADHEVGELDEEDNQAEETFDVEAEQTGGDDEADEGDQEAEQITICHRPPGNPDNAHTITIGEPAWQAHEGHGDTKGECPDEDASTESEHDTEGDTHDDADGHGHDEADESEDSDDGHGPPDHARDRRRGGR